MKIRVLPYGYLYKDGRIGISEVAAKNVTDIFEMYRNGIPLQQIALLYNTKKVEYNQGVVNWNKARIRRILEDVRYLGNDKFPAIIDENVFVSCREIKESRNNQRGIDRSDMIYRIRVPVRCPNCQSFMNRRGKTSNGTPARWYCRAPGCVTVIKKDDQIFLDEIHSLLNLLINEPDLVIIDKENDTFSQADLMKSKISDILATSDESSRAETLKKIYACISEQFKLIPNNAVRSERIKNIFQAAEESTDFPLRLFQRTVREISFSENDNIEITLLNGQIIQGQ